MQAAPGETLVRTNEQRTDEGGRAARDQPRIKKRITTP